jgi:hypothetical protein
MMTVKLHNLPTPFRDVLSDAEHEVHLAYEDAINHESPDFDEVHDRIHAWYTDLCEQASVCVWRTTATSGPTASSTAMLTRTERCGDMPGLKTEGWELDLKQIRKVMSGLSDDELHANLGHTWPRIREAAETEAAARWAETIMPKGD